MKKIIVTLAIAIIAMFGCSAVAYAAEPVAPITSTSAESKLDLIAKFAEVIDSHSTSVTIKVPEGKSTEYAEFLTNSRAFPEIRGRLCYSNGSSEVIAKIKYDDAAVIMSYLEGKRTEINADLQTALNKAKAIVSGLPENATNYEKVKFFHDWLVRNNTYKLDGARSQSLIGALLDGITVCEGYTQAMDLLCYLSDVDCLQIVGYVTANGEYHAWNKVQLDGKWYNVDVTWDNDKAKGLTYDYFLVSDNQLAKDHTFESYAHWFTAEKNYAKA